MVGILINCFLAVICLALYLKMRRLQQEISQLKHDFSLQTTAYQLTLGEKEAAIHELNNIKQYYINLSEAHTNSFIPYGELMRRHQKLREQLTTKPLPN